MPKNLTFHSDRGGQYISDAFSKLLQQFGVKQSFSATARPHDNAVAEAFFATFKKEEAYRRESLWGIEIDNEHKDMVSVYLGDLGRDLPVQEHSHWKQYNIATDARLSTNAVKRDFLCAFTQPEISDLKFKSNFKQFVNTWREQYQWDLFLPLSQNDEYNFKTLHLPITDGQEEFDHLVLSLVKTMIDSLNEKIHLNGISGKA